MAANLTFPETALVLEARSDHLHLGLTQAKEEKRKTMDSRDKSFQTAYLFQAWEISCQPSSSAQAAEPVLQKDAAQKVAGRDSCH